MNVTTLREVTTSTSAREKTPPKEPQSVVWPYRPADYSDAGNSEAFAAWTQAPENTGERLLFCDALGWLHWTGSCWELADYKATEAAKAYARDMLNDATAVLSAAVKRTGGDGDLKSEKAYLKHAGGSRQKRGLDAMLALAKPNLHVFLDDLDADGYKLNCPGGLVDLRTGKVIPHNPSQLCTHICRCDPTKNAEAAAMWERFLDEITHNDAENSAGPLKYYLQQVAGMAAVGKVLTEKAVFLVGKGRNGKSTWLNAIAAVLGSYSGTMPIEVLTTSYRQQRGAVYAELQGKRLIQAGELEQGARLSASVLKQICSTDRIPCERKYCAPGDFVPTHTAVLCSNYLPRIGSDDEGCWRRISVVPFTANFTGQREVKNYADVLVRKAGGAIMQWIVDGAREFIAHGGALNEPEIVQEATEEYRDGEDWLGNFLTETCTTDGGASRTQARTLYDAYVSWARDSGDYVRRERDFSAALETRSYKKINPHGVKYWLGIALKDEYYPHQYS